MPDRPRDDQEAHAKPTELPATETGLSPASGSAEQIGPYRLLSRLGEGGMGEVWLAEQTEPVKRKVALKVIKQGMDTKQVVARFEAERQALALMDHPAIAKVYDAGATSRGRPYFAMQYVQGVPITEHCDRHKLNNRERLRLFMQVCEGVQHAHHKAVIHRDLKPSNVLVSILGNRAVPKIIDFGVAKATAQKLTDSTMQTQLGVLLGTPAYMSPEQAEMTGQDIDTRTDVYALGVMLYELLVGALPFEPKELHQAGLEAMRRKIREEEPPKPSTRLTTMGEHARESAARRSVDLPTLCNQLRGDLDWIVMRALEKDRTRRYGSPQELVADIGRYLNDQPVLASPPSTAYRARKFVRRHRLGVGLAVCGLLVAVAFVTATVVQARRIAAARDRANVEAETARQVAAFLVGLFEVADPTGARGHTITARELLDESSNRIDRELGSQPLIKARLMHTMGNVYQNLGFMEQAEARLEEALRLRTERLGERHVDVAESLSQLGWLRMFQGRAEEAESLQRRALAINEGALGGDHLNTGWALYRLGVVVSFKKRAAEALRYQERALRIFESELGPESRPVSWCQNDIAVTYVELGQHADALAWAKRALRTKEAALGPDHADTGLTLTLLGEIRMRLGEYAEALSPLKRSIAIQTSTLGPDHPRLALAYQTLGELYRRLGRFDDSRTALNRAVEIQQSTLAGQEPETECWILGSLAHLELDVEHYTEAEALFEETLECREELIGTDHLDLAETLDGYARLLRAVDRAAEAESVERRADRIRSEISRRAPED